MFFNAGSTQNDDKSADIFHDRVVKQIDEFKNCVKKNEDEIYSNLNRNNENNNNFNFAVWFRASQM
jgi:hypothetical protein